MKNKGIFLPFIIIYIFVAVIITNNNINKIPSGAELAGILIFFYALFMSIVIFLITMGAIILATQIISKRNLNIGLNIGILLLGLYILHLTTFDICVYENRDYSVESIISKQSNERKKLIKSGKAILAKSNNIFPDKAKIIADSSIVVNYIHNYLDSCIMPLKLSDTKRFNSSFNHFFHLILSDSTRTEKDSLLISTIKNSISLDYIAYSPDEKFIITMSTYSYSENRVGILLLLGERNDTYLELYKGECTNDGDIYIDQEYAFYKFFWDLKYKYKSYKCRCDLSSKSFWDCSNFEKILLSSNYVNKFKVTNKYDSLLKIYKDTIATSFIISSTN